MKFNRVEVIRKVRHSEDLLDEAEIKKVFGAIQSARLKFTAYVDRIGSTLRDCTLTGIFEDSITLYSGFPNRLRVAAKFTEIQQIEVESNCDFVAEEYDSNGRWARLV